MKTRSALVILTACLLVATGLGAQAKDPVSAALGRTFDLGRPRSPLKQRFVLESRMMQHAPDGRITSTDVYRLTLECVPAKLAGTDGDRYTCLGFTVKIGSAPELSIPSLKGWSYIYRNYSGGIDNKGQTLGIPHKPFENLVDQKGQAVPLANAYHVYNAFIDFHTFFVFVTPSASGPSIKDFKGIGQKIVLSKAGATAPTNLEGVAGKGSSFTNGEMSIEFKGLGLANGKSCAIVGYDTGDSSFVMIANPTPAMEVKTVGSSHYHGDIFVDLGGLWIQKASLNEMVVSETTVPGLADKIHGAIERTLSLRNVPVE